MMNVLFTAKEGLEIAIGYQATKIVTELVEKDTTVNSLVGQVTSLLGGLVRNVSQEAGTFISGMNLQNTPELGSAGAAYLNAAWLHRIPIVNMLPRDTLRNAAAGGLAWGIGRFVISLFTRLGGNIPAPLRPQF